MNPWDQAKHLREVFGVAAMRAAALRVADEEKSRCARERAEDGVGA